MWICHCNTFNDEALSKAIDEAKKESGDKPVKLCDVYKKASNGKPPDCGGCLKTIQSHIESHTSRAPV